MQEWGVVGRSHAHLHGCTDARCGGGRCGCGSRVTVLLRWSCTQIYVIRNATDDVVL